MLASSNSRTGQETVGRSQQNQPQALLFSLEMFFFGCGWMACLFSPSVMSNSMIPWTTAHQVSLSLTISWSLLKPKSSEPKIPSNHPSSFIHFSCLQSFPASRFFQWVGYSHQVAKVLELQLQHQSFQWIIRVDFSIGLTGLISLLPNGLSILVSPEKMFGTK